jgi:sensor domain CHASE-containing protein
MRTISIEPQEYLSYGIVNKLSYEILPFIENKSEDLENESENLENQLEGLFPFNYILYYDENEVVNSIEHMTPEELSDWSVYKNMDEKIEGKLTLSFIQNNMYFKNNTSIESNDTNLDTMFLVNENVDSTSLTNENVDSKPKFNLIKYLMNLFIKLKKLLNGYSYNK